MCWQRHGRRRQAPEWCLGVKLTLADAILAEMTAEVERRRDEINAAERLGAVRLEVKIGRDYVRARAAKLWHREMGLRGQRRIE